MAQSSTRPTDASVTDFLAAVEPQRRRDEGHALAALMADVTGDEPVMWGPTIVGFGQYHYRYASGREGDWMKVGFSPRKAQLSLYGLQDDPSAPALLDRLGPHTAGAGCVYIRRLDAIDHAVLRELVRLAHGRGDLDATT